jgi:hypothetical protein
MHTYMYIPLYASATLRPCFLTAKAQTQTHTHSQTLHTHIHVSTVACLCNVEALLLKDKAQTPYIHTYINAYTDTYMHTYMYLPLHASATSRPCFLTAKAHTQTHTHSQTLHTHIHVLFVACLCNIEALLLKDKAQTPYIHTHINAHTDT